MNNCLLLCRAHHRLLHEDGWKVDWWGEGRPVFLETIDVQNDGTHPKVYSIDERGVHERID